MRRGTLFWGIVIILVGVVLLLNSMGYFENVNVWGLVFALGLIVMGLWVLSSIFFGPRKFGAEEAAIPLEGAEHAKVRIRHGAGVLRMDASAEPDMLLNGTFGGGLEHDAKQQGGMLDVEMRTPSFVFPTVIFPGVWIGGEGLAWKFGMSRDATLELDIETGASDARLDLTSLRVSELRLQTGASSTHITMPAEAGHTHARIDAGAASVAVRIPTGVAARVRASGGLASIHVDRKRFPRSGGVYQSPDYDTAANRVDLRVEAGVGSVDIR
jgi:hypothetical protein